MKDTQYIYAVARIRVLERTLLKDEDIRAMAALEDESSVIAYLADHGWGSGESNQTAEEMLSAEEEKLSALMAEMKPDPEVTAVLSLQKYSHNIKAAIKEICTNADVPEAYYPLEDFDREKALSLLKDKQYDELPGGLGNAAERAYDAMSTTLDGQRCDIIMDRACLDQMEEAAEHSSSEMIREYEASSVAVADIRIAYRGAKLGKSLKFLEAALAPCKGVDVNSLSKAAVKGPEELLNYLDGHGYKEAAEAIRESQSAFDRWCDNSLIESIRPQKTNSISAGPVIAYQIGRENEIRNARIILTAKANGFGEEETMERVREMYG